MSKKRTCKGTTKAGEPCPTTPLNPGTIVEGYVMTGDYCRGHEPSLVEAKLNIPKGMGGPQPGSGRPKRPRAIDVLKERMEANIDQVLKPLYDGLSANKSVVVGNGPTAHVETVPDIPTRMAAARELLDRGYGRPKQIIDAVVVTDEDLLERIALIEEQGLDGLGSEPDLPGGEAEV